MNWYAASITYSMPDGTTQVLDGNTMKDWLAVDADGNYSKDENQWNEKVKEYVANLAAAIDTDGKVTPSRQPVSKAA